MEKHKANSTLKRKILITCTTGTKTHPIGLQLVQTLLARYEAGDNLNRSSPLFAMPLKNQNSRKPKFVPLSYNDIVKADKVRTNWLGYDDHNFRSHLRRRGGASDLFDAGCSIRDIKIVGHWSFGVLDPYLSWSQKEISDLQLAGLNRAEQRLEQNWPSRIMVKTSKKL